MSYFNKIKIEEKGEKRMKKQEEIMIALVLIVTFFQFRGTNT